MAIRQNGGCLLTLPEKTCGFKRLNFFSIVSNPARLISNRQTL